ncbi:MAG: hypothetical protein K9G69_08090 [Candidatus Nanopelagicales bacterium]|nr:hypothetical protein [Candidatus Nanopelagicales bacterium]
MSARSSRTRTRLAAIALLATSATLILSGCTKPAPGASVFAGTVTQYREATCWAFNSEELGTGECAQDLIAQAAAGDAVSIIPVIPGETIGISVDPVVADTGWYPVVGNQRLSSTPITSTYYRFTFPELQEVPAEGLLLQIVAGSDSKTRGIWVFKLDPA